MNPIEELVRNFQNLMGEVHEIFQPFIVMLAGAIPFIEGEGGAMIGVVGGVNPVLAGIAGATGNFLAVLIVVRLSSTARTAVVSRHEARAQARLGSPVTDGASGYAGDPGFDPEFVEQPLAKPESKGRQRFKRWLVRFGVPGASILGPLAIPTHFMSAMLVAGGTPRGWVLLWQAVSIALWTTVGTVAVWAALTFLVGV